MPVLAAAVTYQRAWLTWVASTTTCLRALGVDCDVVDVAGTTGYAFVMAVHDELCPSGPTMFDWGMLDHGVNVLGRSTLVFGCSDCYTGDRRNDRTRAHCREAYDLVARETAAGRPCVLWGVYVPEFGVAVGVEDDAFHVKTFREVTGEPQPPVPYDTLDAPGGPYVMAFPTATDLSCNTLHGERFAIGHAVQLLEARSPFKQYGFGLRAYERWIAALEVNRADMFGNAYNAQCWAEAKRSAHAFLPRVAARHPDAAPALERATAHYAVVAEAMNRVATLFPFPPRGEIEDAAKRVEAAERLAVARDAEALAFEALVEAAEA
jgi:hypothetical protein